jgi:myo-inositol-1(or 4)-monophosphatase
LPSFVETAAGIAREAGALIVDLLDRDIGFERKAEFDLVTEADRSSERLIVERLSGHFPSHAIVAEEGTRHESASGYRWYVDPLDGTTNFAHGFPMFCVTMGLERAGERIAGVIFDPLRNEMFTAESGSGAYLNQRPIRVSRTANLKDGLVATGFPSRKRHQDVNVHFFYQLAMASQGVRRGGSAALDLAYVACGRLDAFWEFGLNPWDVAAGVLLVREAGGACSDMHGEPFDIRGPHLLADNGALHQPVIGLFAEVFAGKYRFPMPPMHAAH